MTPISNLRYRFWVLLGKVRCDLQCLQPQYRSHVSCTDSPRVWAMEQQSQVLEMKAIMNPRNSSQTG